MKPSRSQVQKQTEEFIEAQLKAMTPATPLIMYTEVKRNTREPLFPHIPQRKKVLFPHRSSI